MSNSDNEWAVLKKDYLSQIEKCLSSAKPDTLTQILEDVEDHLQQRFEELGVNQHSTENYQQIIREMGPAESYLQYLADDEKIKKRSKKPWILGICCLLIGAGIALSPFLRNMIQDYGKNANMLSHQAWQAWRSGEYERSRSLFKRSLKKDNQNPSAWNGLGWACFHLGEFKNAEAAFQRCVAINDDFSGAWNGLGYLARMQNQTDKAIEYWKKSIEASSTATAAYDGLSHLYMELEQYDEAAEYFKQWINVDPHNPDAKTGLQQALQQFHNRTD